MPPSRLKCQRCRGAGPVYLDGEMMLCQGCVARPPASAYFGSIVAVSALSFVGVMTLTGVLYFAIDFYVERKNQSQPPVTRPIKPVEF